MIHIIIMIAVINIAAWCAGVIAMYKTNEIEL